MSIYEIIEQVANTSSTKEKQVILEKHKDNELLRLCFLYAESPRIQFWIKCNEPLFNGGTDEISQYTFNLLNDIVQRQVTGNEARELLRSTLKLLDLDSQDIVSRIVNKDLRCGAGTAIVNKVWKDLIPEYPCLLCGKYDAKAEKYLSQFEHKEGFIVQLKSDGGRLIVKVDTDGNVTYHSRAGNTLDLFGVFDAQFSKYADGVFDGELVVMTKDGKPNRKMSNGFYTKAVRGTLTKEEAEQFSIVLWDVIPANEYITKGYQSYETRLAILKQCGFTGKVTVTYGKRVKTLAECMEFYTEMRNDGQEGAIIKVASAVWEDSRSKNYVKLKAVNDIDARCIGVEEGAGKYAGKIGSLVCETADGLVNFNVGTGLNDADRAKPPSHYIGQIIECTYNEVITAKGRATKSLFLPVFRCVRWDKTTPNSLEDLK